MLSSVSAYSGQLVHSGKHYKVKSTNKLGKDSRTWQRMAEQCDSDLYWRDLHAHRHGCNPPLPLRCQRTGVGVGGGHWSFLVNALKEQLPIRRHSESGVVNSPITALGCSGSAYVLIDLSQHLLNFFLILKSYLYCWKLYVLNFWWWAERFYKDQLLPFDCCG